MPDIESGSKSIPCPAQIDIILYRNIKLKNLPSSKTKNTEQRRSYLLSRYAFVFTLTSNSQLG